MLEDHMVTHPPHYGDDRFGIECIEFSSLMMFNPGNAFKYVWRCEDKGNAVQDLEKARTYWQWAWEANQPIFPVYNRLEIRRLCFAYLEPKVSTDWMARVLTDMIWEEWDAASEGIDTRHAFFVAKEGQP